MRKYIVPTLMLLTFVSTLFTACITEIELELPDPPDKIVVEASIATGGVPSVILTRNFPYFGSITVSDIANNYVRNAEVAVSDGETTVNLDEICFSDFTPEQLEELGIEIDDSLAADFDFCIYTLLLPSMVGENGKTYSLNINTPDGDVLSAVTSIPQPVALDSFWTEQHNNPDYPEYYRLYTQFKDPDTLGNYYRYFTQRNEEPEYPGFNSVFDDLLVNGVEFFFPVDRAVPKGAEIEFDTFGYFELGDTVTVRWTSIDKTTYDFFQTLEYSLNSSSPLGTTSSIRHNIEGGIGVWAGYGVGTIYTTIITEE